MIPFYFLCYLCIAAGTASDDVWEKRISRSITHHSNGVGYQLQTGDVLVTVPVQGQGHFVGFTTSVELQSGNTSQVNIFLGIPYAEPPLIERRLQMPYPAYLNSSNSNKWIAKKYSNRCPEYLIANHQVIDKTLFNEDCLYLNIFTSNVSQQAKLPVLFHIHGGSLLSGGSREYPGQFFASKGVVVVTTNYRTNMFGLLTTGSWEAPGNLALWDQRLALQWVHDYISWFGGDPAQVTISGESAGAASVGFHVLSSRFSSSNFFHRAVMMSGSDTAPWAVSRPYIGQQEKVTKLSLSSLGCHQSFISDKLNCFRKYNVSYISLFKNTEEVFNMYDFDIEPMYLWAAVVDGVFLPNFPFALRQKRDFLPVPLLVGMTDTEMAGRSWDIEQFTTLRSFIRYVLTGRNKKKIPNLENLVNNIRDAYLDGKSEDSLSAAEFKALKEDIQTDSDVGSHVLHAAVDHTDVGQPVYFYMFNYSGAAVNSNNYVSRRVNHGNDLPFVWGYPLLKDSWWTGSEIGSNHFPTLKIRQKYFQNRIFNNVDDSEADKRMSWFIIDLWANFIKYGNPTPHKVKGFKWPKVEKVTSDNNLTEYLINCAKLNSPNGEVVIDKRFKVNKIKAWRQVYEHEYQYVLSLQSSASSVYTKCNVAIVFFLLLIVVNLDNCFVFL